MKNRICVELTPDGAAVEIAGGSRALVDMVTMLFYSLEKRTNINTQKLCLVLPLLMEAKKAEIDGETYVDMSAIANAARNDEEADEE